MLRVLYELLCLKNPQESLGLGAGEPIHIVPFSHRKEAARRVVFGGVANKLNLAPFFRGRFEFTLDEIRFKDKGVYITGGSSQDAGALGLNLFCAIMDELNFMGRGKASANSASGEQFDKAQMIYDNVRRRIKSRYQHAGVKGIVFLVSSKKATDDFTERRIKEAANEPHVFVRDYATWDVKPSNYSDQKWWRCVVSPKGGRSRVLEENEEDPPGCQIIKFPNDFLVDFRRDPDGCFTGDTKIALLDGSNIPIKDLVGVPEFWTYSYSPDGRLFPGRGHSARLTHKNAPIVAVELDNGEKIRCTSNHLFMLRDGSYVEAGKLIPGTSLMPLYRKSDKWGYEQVKSNVGGRWLHTHRVIAREAHLNGVRVAEGHVVHHKNFNKIDNTPGNLEVMSAEEHRKLHSVLLSKSLHTPEAKKKSADSRRRKAKEDPEFRANLIKILKEGQKNYIGSDYHKQVASKNGKLTGWGTTNITKLNKSDNNPSYKLENRSLSSKRLKALHASKTSSERSEFSRRGGHKRWRHSGSYEDCRVCQDPVYRDVAQGHRRCKHPGSVETCNSCLARLGPTNHKVVSVTECGFEDVYDITVDVHHNFALTSGVVVHNSLRDIAGVATDAVNPFIVDRKAVDDMMTPIRPHPFTTYEWHTEDLLRLELDKFMTKNARGELVPICCPGAQRHAHLDLSRKFDATGLCVGHRGPDKEVKRKDENNRDVIDVAPTFHIDLVLRITASKNGEIDHETVRSLLFRLVEVGMPLRSVTMDQWCYTPNAQAVRSKGLRVEEQSVVRTLLPYLTARSALYEGRIESPVYEALRKELYDLEWTKEQTRVDHPTHSSKDLADAWAAVIYYLAERGIANKFIAPSKGFNDGSVTTRMAQNGGAVYLGNGEFIWPDEAGPNSAQGYDGIPSFIIM